MFSNLYDIIKEVDNQTIIKLDKENIIELKYIPNNIIAPKTNSKSDSPIAATIENVETKSTPNDDEGDSISMPNATKYSLNFIDTPTGSTPLTNPENKKVSPTTIRQSITMGLIIFGVF